MCFFKKRKVLAITILLLIICGTITTKFINELAHTNKENIDKIVLPLDLKLVSLKWASDTGELDVIYKLKNYSISRTIICPSFANKIPRIVLTQGRDVMFELVLHGNTCNQGAFIDDKYTSPISLSPGCEEIVKFKHQNFVAVYEPLNNHYPKLYPGKYALGLGVDIRISPSLDEQSFSRQELDSIITVWFSPNIEIITLNRREDGVLFIDEHF